MDFFAEDQTYDKIDFRATPLQKSDYDHCMFVKVEFSGVDLSGIKFIDCQFSGCNLTTVQMAHTVFRDVLFKDCKMMGLRFDTADKFGLSFRFEDCILDHSSFYQTELKKTIFIRTQLKQADLTGCDLTEAVFDHCDLAGATFEHTVLEKADLRTAFNYAIDPEMNRIKRAKFSLAGVAGLLGKYDIEIGP